ncbi:exported hypothetical protein [Candidatus Sulfotelmatobacter sp. SbA7]|nr:exported hypothetical protein [Candidatus Sulfotelmatobacter sp. SbA7]
MRISSASAVVGVLGMQFSYGMLWGLFKTWSRADAIIDERLAAGIQDKCTPGQARA